MLATYAWDDLGRRATLTRGDGSVLTYGYDAVSRMTSFADNLVGSGYDQTLGFGYTPASQITSNTRSNDAYAWTGHYNLNRSYTANGRNQYSAVASITPTYDSKGNLTSAGSTTYAYSSENLLTSASGGIALSYDPAMRLYQTSGGSAGTARFAYDGAALIAEYNGSNALLRRYVHGPGADEPLVWYEGSGTSDRRFLHADERGSVVAVTNSSGTTLNLNGYDEYGIPSSGNVGRFQYTGQTWLPELGMYNYKARIYSPYLGRFLQTDPIGYGDGMNLYGYVGADSINRTDPSGLCIIENWTMHIISNGRDLGPEPGSGWVVFVHCERFFSLFGTGGASFISNDGGSADGPGVSAPPPQATPIQLRPSTKKYLCQKLALHGFDIPATYSDIFAFRSKSRENMQVAEPREAENWIYATGNWRRIPTDGTSRFMVRVYQKYLKPIFSNATPYSEDALNAGLNGADHRGLPQAQLSGELKDYCHG